MPEPAASNLLAIDYGERTIGVAVANSLIAAARPLAPLSNGSRAQLAAAISRLISDWRPATIVIGLPLDSHGEDTDMSRRIRRFAAWLAELAPTASIRLHDERLSSEHAAREFASRRQSGRARRRDAARLDSVAAALILDSWMSEHPHV